jgi:LysR family glycine cleavage system transcriptional activator
MPPLSALRAFEAAGRLLSFTLAADELGVTQSAISRQIKVLEDHLQRKVFVRRTRSISLTSEGETLLRAVSHGLEHIRAATIRLTRSDRHLFLNLSCLPTLAVKWLMPRMADFSHANPKIDVRLSTTLQPAELGQGVMDFAIRVGNPKQTPDKVAPRIDLTMTKGKDGLAYEFLFPDVLIVVCTPELAQQGLKDPMDLQAQMLIHNAFRENAWADWLTVVGLRKLKPKGELSLSHYFTAIQAACEGRGVALLPHVLVAQELKAGTLVVPFAAPVKSAGDYYLLSREEDAERPEHRLFRKWLLAEAKTFRNETAAYI